MPILIIGNHYLEGKRIALKKPLAIINKERAREEDVSHTEQRFDDGEIAYTLAGVVKFKYIFKNRPKPL